MPQYTLEIPNAEETISNTIVISALNRIIRTYKWYRGFDFKFLNLGESILVKGSEIDIFNQDRSQQRLDTDTTVEVEVSERYNEEMSRASAIRERTQLNIFGCPKTRVTMHPGYQQMIADISMRFRFSTRHAAENFRRRVRLASTKSVDGMQLEAKCTYTIPYQFLYILQHVHGLMENNHGYGIDFGTWVRENFTNNLTTLANQSGSRSVLAIAEINQGILVLVNSPDDTPQKEKENESDAYTVTMEFEVFYDRPDVMRMSLPHVIHNQCIDFNLLNRNKPQTIDLSKTRTHIALLDALETGSIPIGKNMLSGATSPVFDDWYAPYLTRSYPDFLRCLLLVDEEDYGNVMDIHDITDWDLTPATLAWLKDTRATIQKKNFNIFWFRLWEYDMCKSLDILGMDEDGKIRTSEPLDPRKNYHLTISMCIEPGLLDKSVWDKLRDHPDFFKEWLGVIAPEFIPKINDFFKEYYDKFKDTSSENWHSESGNGWGGEWSDMPDWVLKKIQDQLAAWAARGIDRFKMRTVLIHGIIAKRKGVDYRA